VSSFNFKSAGKKISNRKYTNISKTKKTLVPIGLKTPLQIISNSEDLYHTHTSPEKQIKDNIKNFLLTNQGERLGRYKFGANLSSYVFETSRMTGPELKQALINQITNKISKYFSSVVITDMSIVLKAEDTQTEVKKTLAQTTYHNESFTTEAPSSNNNNPSGIAKIVILMTFSIPGLQITNQKIETTIFAGG
jgi:phage baseplate assembly protein W